MSEEENDRLNEKIDRLIAVVQAHRPLQFVANTYTGDVDIYTDHRGSYPEGADDRNPDSGDDLEAEIAKASQDFGNILVEGDRFHLTQSLNSHDEDSGSLSDGWETVTSAGRVWSESASGTPDVKPRNPYTILRSPKARRKRARGSRLLRLNDSGNFNGYEKIVPLPLNHVKKQHLRTPSISSGDSKVDCSSTLFQKCQYAELLRINESSKSNNEPVLRWLDGLEMPQHTVLPIRDGRKNKAVTVLRDDTRDQQPQRTIAPSDALRDVSNLRQPGYLQYNSFAQEDKLALPIRAKPSTAMCQPDTHGTDRVSKKHGTKGESESPSQPPPTLPFGGASNLQTCRAFIKSRWPVLRSSGIESSSQMAERPLHPNPERAKHFEFSLARLEGRMPIEYSAPIRQDSVDEGTLL